MDNLSLSEIKILLWSSHHKTSTHQKWNRKQAGKFVKVPGVIK